MVIHTISELKMKERMASARKKESKVRIKDTGNNKSLSNF